MTGSVIGTWLPSLEEGDTDKDKEREGPAHVAVAWGAHLAVYSVPLVGEDASRGFGGGGAGCKWCSWYDTYRIICLGTEVHYCGI